MQRRPAPHPHTDLAVSPSVPLSTAHLLAGATKSKEILERPSHRQDIRLPWRATWLVLTLVSLATALGGSEKETPQLAKVIKLRITTL